jgi:hypothetical protein
VRHCNIRGFSAGISLNSSNLANGGHLIEDNRFDGNTGYAIIISGDGSLIRNNQVNDTGFVTLNGGGEAIYAYGWIDVINNTVAGVHGTSTYEVRGIETEYDNGSIAGNRVSGLAGNSSTYSTAIFAGSSHGTIRDNNVFGTNLGYNYGLYCSNNGAVAKDNVVNHVGTGISNCSDAGGNDVAY